MCFLMREVLYSVWVLCIMCWRYNWQSLIIFVSNTSVSGTSFTIESLLYICYLLYIIYYVRQINIAPSKMKVSDS